ncbi:type II CRISPR RNA-guided endonuclease Cas9 [Polluticaenibacter yanchengensis]|uniref:CRISPR-associated endonuclease Cas9 n=1 Tax=Polluticaenibacter yanchengensis TaxID=3014562 RepID=A0ABT4UKR6_9BACT|nr:type II CRISPR RNA-guided endonuclease Cas9 [Chitinophagaceae bacterium LY-5]
MARNILGLDLGTTSIGWALIKVDDNHFPIEIIAMGSRIIPLSSDERDQFQKGQAISKNQERTTIRTQRKGYDRKQLKKSDDFKYSLKKALEAYGIFPSKELFNLPMLDLWKLRSDAASQAISPEQLGRILYMLNQKRGYKSARSEANADKKDTDYVHAVKSRYAQLKDRNQTIGQFFYEGLKNAAEQNQYFRIKEEVYPREAYVEEFDTIINMQKGHHPFLTDELIHSLRNEIIYYQRKLKSQKGLLNVCEFEGFEKSITDKSGKEKKVFVGPKVSAKSNPLFQLSRIWETVNNINLKVKNPPEAKYKWSDRIPTSEEKEQIAAHLFKNEQLSYSDLLKILNLKKDEVYSNKQILKGIKGNLTYNEIYKIIGDNPLLNFEVEVDPNGRDAYIFDRKTGEILEERQGAVINKEIEQQPFYQLWHTIYSIKDLSECKLALIKRFGFSEDIAAQLSCIDFDKQGYGNKSVKSIRKTLPYLMKGYNLYESESLAGYVSRSLTKDELEKTGTDEKLSLLPKNSLRQPVVEKILNQMINIVNAIIDKYGKPVEVVIEMARELKQSKDERDATDKLNAFNKKVNDKVAVALKELGLPATKRFIEKYKFISPTRDKSWEASQVVNQCIYCGDSFGIVEALNGDAFDVDHIVPKALLFDDSQTNKVLVHRRCNGHKTNQTAYDYIAKKGEVELNAYLARVDDWFKRGIISYSKMNRLKVSFEQYQERKKNKKETEGDKKIWESFIDRNLRETQYITRKSKEILGNICNKVRITEGNVTAKLRNLWGWDDILLSLQLPKFKELEQTEIKEWTSEHGRKKHEKVEIANWSKRDDHRHHAIDALAIACTTQSFIQRINTLNASDVRNEMNKEVEEAKSQFNEKMTLLEKYLVTQKPFETVEVAKAIDEILISFKPGKKVASVSKFKAKGKNNETGVLTPRGALHEQSVYGKIRITEKNKPLKYLFENTEKIIDKNIQQKILNKIEAFEGDIKKAIGSLKKSPIYMDDTNVAILETADCFKEEIVIKYKLDSLKAKDVPYIVDKKVKELVQQRLDAHGGKEKEAFKTTLWYNETKQIPIRTVRCFTGLSAVEAIKKDESGNDIGFVVLGNNHHIAIYKDKEGKLSQHSCTFWHAVERKKFKLPTMIEDTSVLWNNILGKELPQSFLDKLPADNLKLEHSLQQNEMFILGLSKDEVEKAIAENNKSVISKHLYLVWSIGENQYWFRHHLETKNSELKQTVGAKESKRYYLFKSVGAFLIQNPMKVKIDCLGNLKSSVGS